MGDLETSSRRNIPIGYRSHRRTETYDRVTDEPGNGLIEPAVLREI